MPDVPSAVRGGVVRPARRPRGWSAPGPPPTGDASLVPGPREDLCHLSGDWRIFQRVDGQRWSLDDLVTAWCAAEELRPCPPARFVDLGCGIGAVLMMLAWRFPRAAGLGVEAVPLSVGLARRSLAWNGVTDRCEVRSGDLRDAGAIPEGPAFDLVTGTPPYLPLGTATASPHVQRAPCHLEHRGGVEAYCDAAARLLAPGAPAVVCAGAGHEARVEAGATGAGLVVARRRAVIPRAGKPPLFGVYTMHRADEVPAAARIDPPLVVRDARGQWTPAFRDLRRAMGLPVAVVRPPV